MFLSFAGVFLLGTFSSLSGLLTRSDAFSGLLRCFAGWRKAEVKIGAEANDSLRKGKVQVLHHKSNDIAVRAAAETVEASVTGIYFQARAVIP